MEDHKEDDTPITCPGVVHDVVKVSGRIHARPHHRSDPSLFPPGMLGHEERRTIIPTNHPLRIMGQQEIARVIDRGQKHLVDPADLPQEVKALVDPLIRSVPWMDVHPSGATLF